MNWSTDKVELGSVVELRNGYAFKSKLFSDDPEDVPLVKGSNLQHREVRWNDGPWWPRGDAAEYERFQLTTGDVVIAMDRPIVGGQLKYAWLSEWEPDALLVQRVCRLRGTEQLDQTFLRYIIGSPDFHHHVQRITTGVNVPHISGGDIQSFEFLLPPLPAQRRIADILSAYDDLIENNSRRMDLLEESVHLLYREWFVYLRFPGHERTEIMDGVPKGWIRAEGEHAIAFNPRTPIPKDQVRPYVPMGSISTNSMRITDIDERVPKGGAKFRNGDTLLARITPCLENGKTGYVQFMATANEAASGSTEFIVMRGKTMPASWVYCLARSPDFRQEAINRMSGSDGRQRVDWKALAKVEILIPSDAVAVEFDNVAEGVFREIRLLNKYNEKLREARDVLLPRLMDGRIPV